MSQPLYYSSPIEAKHSTPHIPALHELAHQYDLHIEMFPQPRPTLFQRLVAWVKGL